MAFATESGRAESSSAMSRLWPAVPVAVMLPPPTSKRTASRLTLSPRTAIAVGCASRASRLPWVSEASSRARR